jgi:hypothetical protein
MSDRHPRRTAAPAAVAQHTRPTCEPPGGYSKPCSVPQQSKPASKGPARVLALQARRSTGQHRAISPRRAGQVRFIGGPAILACNPRRRTRRCDNTYQCDVTSESPSPHLRRAQVRNVGRPAGDRTRHERVAPLICAEMVYSSIPNRRSTPVGVGVDRLTKGHLNEQRSKMFYESSVSDLAGSKPVKPQPVLLHVPGHKGLANQNSRSGAPHRSGVTRLH